MAKSGHVMIFESNTSWGGIWVYEAKGCNYGVVHNTRSVSWGTWTVAERKNLVGTQCSPGQVQTQGCGKCGSKERTCSATGNWGSWGGCAGRGPCSPGQTQSQGCGNCGNKGRSCQSNCQWGGWGSCQGQGSCAPGQVNTEGCGNCGNHGRSCQSNCQWGGWGSCEGQGPCAPGQVHTEDCGDCGTHTRGCQTNCYWADWSPCEGPDPGDGKIPCDTGELGVCADGRQRCHQGWVTCVRLVDPSDELCDGLDNDCDGPVDEDRPQFMGFSPPAHAADLVELSYKPVLGPGETGQAWAVFVNRGSEAWSKREIWLRAAGGEDGEESRFRVPGAWPAWDVAAVLPEDVPPGGMARLEFTVRAPVEPAGWFHERFVLLDPDGEEIRCPRPDFQLSIQVGSGGFAGPQSAEHEAVEPFPDSGPPDLEAGTRGGCGVVPSPQPGGGGGPWFILLMLAVSYAVWHRKTRCVK